MVHENPARILTKWKVVQKYLVIDLFIKIITRLAYMLSDLNAYYNANYYNSNIYLYY